MEANIPPQRPQHRQNASSKSNILRALVPPKSRSNDSDAGSSPSRRNERTQTVPLLPPDHPHSAKSKVLGERQSNVQSPPSSPSKSRQKSVAPSKTSDHLRTTQSPKKGRDVSASPKKSKSSTNLSAVFAKMNRSSKDFTQPVQRDKENTTPPSSSSGPLETHIWAQYASGDKQNSRPSTSDSNKCDYAKEQIAMYTPTEYSPSKQRNFNGSFEQPQLRPTLAKRPQSAFFAVDVIGALGRRVSSDRAEIVGRKSEDLERRKRVSVDNAYSMDPNAIDRKTSGSSTEQAPLKERLTIAKRGGRVMAAVAAFQSKSKDPSSKKEATLDPKAVDRAFEAVLDSRNVPEPMRQKMRSLTLRVKADFVKQDQQASQTVKSSPIGPAESGNAKSMSSPTKATNSSPTDDGKNDEESKSTKRSRPRSRTFTFSKGDKRGADASPSKRQRPQSKSRATSTHSPTESSKRNSSTPNTPRTSLDKGRAATTVPADYIAYLKENQDPVHIEVGRLHKLRILLRNETVAWVDSFISLGGMSEIVALLHRIMAVEWREEHEDQLLHETLLCLKGLCTTGRAMVELEKVADGLFPALLGMLYDEEKKGPAEYSTRTIVTTVLFNFLASATGFSPEHLEKRARRILTYLGEPSKPEEARPVDFVLDMRAPRPYKLWCREVSNVTKEVFWIFLHHLNVVPLPKKDDRIADEFTSPTDSVIDDANLDERAKVVKATYQQRNFPGTRPPVPAAPYIGGVEWDATIYITSHIDLLNGIIASLPTPVARNTLRVELQASGFEKVFGATLRTCKEKFYCFVHDALRAWVAAAAEDGWDTRFVREGPTEEERGERAMKSYGGSPKKSPGKKKVEMAPKIEALPKLELQIDDKVKSRKTDVNDDDDDGWLG